MRRSRPCSWTSPRQDTARRPWAAGACPPRTRCERPWAPSRRGRPMAGRSCQDSMSRGRTVTPCHASSCSSILAAHWTWGCTRSSRQVRTSSEDGQTLSWSGLGGSRAGSYPHAKASQVPLPRLAPMRVWRALAVWRRREGVGRGGVLARGPCQSHGCLRCKPLYVKSRMPTQGLTQNVLVGQVLVGPLIVSMWHGARASLRASSEIPS
mmetsp:Transcript_147968/g.475110  ORF Transcript_147968/g.475110 Transcript_147968/m.475110 type:complete len:209 (+) Transcript_147968:176-802(+)